MNRLPVNIVILNYRNWEDTRDCLRAVFRSVYQDFTVFVIDNDSQNQSIDQLAEWAAGNERDAGLPQPFNRYTAATFRELTRFDDLPRLNFIQNHRNTGFAAANNLVLAPLSRSDSYVWLLNPDIVIQDNCLGELVSFAARQSPASVIGASVYKLEGNKELLFYGGGRVRFYSGTVQPAGEKPAPGELDYISGASLFTHSANFRKQGLLPEEYFLYWEETDWCYRAKQAGLALLVCEKAVCYDKVSRSIGKGYLADYYYCRNGLLFISRYGRRNLPLALFLVKWRWLKRIFTGQWKRAGGTWRGTIDFLKKKFNEIQ